LIRRDLLKFGGRENFLRPYRAIRFPVLIENLSDHRAKNWKNHAGFWQFKFYCFRELWTNLEGYNKQH